MVAISEAFFLPSQAAPAWSRLCIHHMPEQVPVRALVVYAHPFAEEMNKSRRMAALQSRALARAGFAVLQIDLTGCGDSGGEFGDATWSLWVDDLIAAAHWLREFHANGASGTVPLWLWGLRTGSLLAAAAAKRDALDCNLLFWQPVHSGAAALQQFLRMKTAGDVAAGTARTTVEALRQQLACGEPVEVAGYRLAPDLARGMEAARLVLPDRPAPVCVRWFETSQRESQQLLPASAALVDGWIAAGHDVRAEVVRGPAFWQTVEVEEAPALIAATTDALAEQTDAHVRAA
jgi:exosortase A-associated hydrolase 2